MGYRDPGRSALVVISEGIAGLTELSFELEPARRGQGGGAGLVHDALTVIPSGQLAVAAVAPGNAASLRALLAATFTPLASLQLFRRTSRDPSTPIDTNSPGQLSGGAALPRCGKLLAAAGRGPAGAALRGDPPGGLRAT